MKICYLADAHNVITEKWLNSFAAIGHEVHLITKRLASDWRGEGYAAGVNIHYLAAALPSGWPGAGYANFLPEFLHARRIINALQPDIVHAHAIGAYAYIAAMTGYHPLVMSVWGSDVLLEPRRNPLLRTLKRYALKRADLVTCNGEHLMVAAVRLGAAAGNTAVIYHGVDTNRFRPAPGAAIPGVPEGAPVVVSTRKLRPVYHLEMLLRAVPLVRARVPEAVFVLAGDGEQRKRLEALAGSLGVAGAVRFAGWVPPDKLPGLLAAADVYVSTSLSDGTSISLQEAMACGLPPVVTDIPANRPWVEEGKNGYRVAIDDVAALAERIVGLIGDGKLREKFGREGRRVIQARAELGREMAKMEGLYRRLVAGRPEAA
jgi:glycosyltransferase involved in cell wall biosynthesis